MKWSNFPGSKTLLLTLHAHLFCVGHLDLGHKTLELWSNALFVSCTPTVSTSGYEKWTPPWVHDSALFWFFYLATLFYYDCVGISTVLSARTWPQWLQKKKNLGNDCTKCDLNTEAFTPATETWWICLSLSQNDGWCNSEKKEKKLQKCWCRNRRSWNRKQSYQRGLFFISCRLTHVFQPLHLPHCHLRI